MQNRYTGDIGDFGKLGLLRQLSRAGLSVGVNWYLVPDEAHNSDGRHIGYLQKDDFRSCDEELLLTLRDIVKSGKRKISALENNSILSDTAFYSEVLDLSNMASRERPSFRQDWHTRAVDQLCGCDVIFADPDNGLIVRSAEGTAKSSKYVLLSELADYYQAGSSVIYYQHKARQEDRKYIQQHHELLMSGAFPGASGLGMKFTRTSQRFYFFILRPEHKEQVSKCITQMMESPWRKCFEYLPDTLFKGGETMFGPDPNTIHPNKNIPSVCYIKNTITRPNIIVGDYTYYDDPADSEHFEDHVTHHYDFIGDKLIIGKFCAIAKGVEFIMNGANHRMCSVTTYPFNIMGGGWEKSAPRMCDLPLKGDTVVGSDVWIGQNVTIMPGIHIGDGAIIGADSVVAKDIPAYCIAAGNPCTVVKKRFDDELIEYLLALKWWDWPAEKIFANLEALTSADLTKIRRIEADHCEGIN